MSELFFKGTPETVLLPLTAECLTASGGTTKVNFKGRYRRIGVEEQKQVRQQLAESAVTGEEVIRQLLVGWSDVQDKDGEPVEYSPENREAALLNPYYLDALGDGALIIVYGKKLYEEIKRKNSSKQAAAG